MQRAMGHDGLPSTIKNAYIDITGCLVGEVYGDVRWRDGTTIRTTMVEAVRTRNTFYNVELKPILPKSITG